MPRRRFAPHQLGASLQSQFLDDYQLAAEEFAAAIHVPDARVQRVLAGQEPVDADLALRLARLLGGSADGWLHWQSGYELWNAREQLGATLDAITPLDPDTRLSVLEDEPLEPELVAELRRRMADVHDPRRWVIVSATRGEDVPLHEEDIGRMFYDVETSCYCTGLLGATAFKRQEDAAAVAATLGKRKRVVEVTTQDLEKPRRNEAVDCELRERFFRNTGQGMSEWDIATFLRNTGDMAAYLEAVVEDGGPELIAAAVADVMKAMTAQTTVEYLKERGALGDRDAFESALGKVADVPPDKGDACS